MKLDWLVNKYADRVKDRQRGDYEYVSNEEYAQILNTLGRALGEQIILHGPKGGVLFLGVEWIPHDE